MAFFLRKAVEALMMPIGFSALVIAAGLFFRRRWISVAGLILLIVLSTGLGGEALLLPLERAYEPRTIAECPNADAIVVLSGNIVRGIAKPGVQWGVSANRYFTGVQLALAGKAKLLVFTGAPTGPRLTEGGILRQVAIGQGMAPDRVVVTGPVLTTAEEAHEVSVMPGVHTIVLVTSAFHMSRAAMIFRAAGLQVIPFPTDLHYFMAQPPFLFLLLPSSEGINESEAAIHEYYGLAVYRILLLFHHAPSRG
jgi:uncharacterized SAM-binding protein YcdF (DUF218 family)